MLHVSSYFLYTVYIFGRFFSHDPISSPGVQAHGHLDRLRPQLLAKRDAGVGIRVRGESAMISGFSVLAVRGVEDARLGRGDGRGCMGNLEVPWDRLV